MDQVEGAQVVDQVAETRVVLDPVAGAQMVDQLAGVQVVVDLYVAGTHVNADRVAGTVQTVVVILV